MIRLAISVEGKTEEDFCKNILKPLFAEDKVYLTPINMRSNLSVDRVKSEINKLIKKFDFVSTMYDFYGFKGNYSSADALEKELKNGINSTRFIPYIQQYEFETLLFSKPSYYGDFLNKKAEEEINDIINEFNGNIENINNSKATSPSHRIIDIFKKHNEKYDKVFYGHGIIENIGLDIVREKCPRFNKWINKISNLKDENNE